MIDADSCSFLFLLLKKEWTLNIVLVVLYRHLACRRLWTERCHLWKRPFAEAKSCTEVTRCKERALSVTLYPVRHPRNVRYCCFSCLIKTICTVRFVTACVHSILSEICHWPYPHIFWEICHCLYPPILWETYHCLYHPILLRDLSLHAYTVKLHNFLGGLLLL